MSTTLLARTGTATVPAATAAPSRSQFACVVFAIAMAVWPIVSLDLPALLDLPNNLARACIGTHLGADPFYDSLYRQSPPVVPNAGFDVFFVAVKALLPPMAIAQLFATLSVIATVTGAIALTRVLGGHVALVALLAGLSAHNYSLTWGFLNYQLGVGLCLWAGALWFHVRRRSIAQRVVLPGLVATALFYCHAIPLALYGLVVVVSELELWRRERMAWMVGARRTLVAGLQFVVPALMVVSSPTTAELAHAEVPDLLASLRGCAKAFHAGLGTADYVHVAVLAAIAVALLGFGRLRVVAGMRWSVVLLGAACLLVPDKTMQASCLQQRLPSAVASVAVAALLWRPRHPKFAMPLLCSIACALLGRTVLLCSAYTQRAAMLREAAVALSVVPDRALLYTATGTADSEDGWEKYRAPVLHAACLRALDAHVFLPQLLVSALHHTLAPANETVAEANLLFELEPPVRSPDDLRLNVRHLADLVRRGRARRECPPLPGGIWMVAVHFPADFAYPADIVDVMAQTAEITVLRVR